MALGLALAGVLLAATASLALGGRSIPFGTVLDALIGEAAGEAAVTIRTLRLPRTILGAAAGAALGMAGALMQVLTRNPLADPGVLGINAGAALAVVVGITVLGAGSVDAYVWLALPGAAASGVLVYAIGTAGRGSASPVRLALAGAALTASLVAATTTVVLLDGNSFDQYRFWSVGSLAGRPLSVATSVAPFLAVGALLALGLARSLDAVALGEDTARALGVRVGTTRALAALSATLLTGASVAAVGPVGFVGLTVPHAARSLWGAGHSWLLAGSALLGAALVLAADTAGRLVARPGELEVGVVTALVGAPVFVALVRRRRMVAL